MGFGKRAAHKRSPAIHPRAVDCESAGQRRRPAGVGAGAGARGACGHDIEPLDDAKGLLGAIGEMLVEPCANNSGDSGGWFDGGGDGGGD